MKSRLSWNRKEWDHVTNNEIERFYFLGAVDIETDVMGTGLPDSVVDFKRYFTLPPEEIYRQVALTDANRAQRRYRLSDLWREDLQRRAMSYMQRVGLPDAGD